MKICCIGRNYVGHVRELNNPLPEQPLIFMKPSTALLKAGQHFPYPAFSSDVHYEGEIVLRIGRLGKNIPEQEALDYIDAYTLGIDFTARDVQSVCKKKGHPWEIAKAFDNAAVIGDLIPASSPLLKGGLNMLLKKNRQTVQQGHSKQMIFPFERLIAYLSIYFTLEPGDLIFTGTPEGVGPVKTGDLFTGFVSPGSTEHADSKVFELHIV